jgi:LIVCS family branched-chain amino acid:cation transporter
LEGYQTYDALAGLLTGGIVVISVHNYRKDMSFEQKRRFIARSGLVAMMGLFIIYAGLILLGAKFNAQFPEGISRIELLTGLSGHTLGDIGTAFLSVLVALACFTTAIGIIVGTADFFSGLFKNSKRAYLYAALICCIIGVAIGQMDVKYIIEVALPVLMFIYPLCVALILLHIVPERYASRLVFRLVVLVTFLFSIPDFLSFLIPSDHLHGIKNLIPFARLNLGWVLPALIVFLAANIPNIIK